MKHDVFSTKFAQDIFLQKYSMNGQETWSDLCKRVVTAVTGQYLTNEEQDKIFQYMFERKFIPGGRYLYSSGRAWHQVNNCFLFRAEDSREKWAELADKSISSLMSGGGIGVDYSLLRPEGAIIKKTGGTSTGPISLMKIINESGREVMQGGQRRSAIWAGLNWKHNDIKKFISLKDYSEEIKSIKAKDFTFPVPMELTNISVIYDTEFFVAIENKQHPEHKLAKEIWLMNCKQAFSTAEPGMSFNFCKDSESLRNACVTGETTILTQNGYKRIDSLVDTSVDIWNGHEWSKVTPKVTGKNQQMLTVKFSDGRSLTCTDYHTFHIAKGYTGKFDKILAKNLKVGMNLIKSEFPVLSQGEDLKNAYTQGFVAAEGMESNKTLWVYKPKESSLPRLASKSVKWEEDNKRFRVLLEETPVSKKYVPLNCNLRSKLDWLSGLFDGDGTELKEGGLQLGSIDREFLINVQSLLSTLGVQSKISLGNKEGLRQMPDGRGGSRDFYCQDLYRICIGAVQMQQLKSLGLSCERMLFDKTPQRDASQFVKVIEVTKVDVVETVYCFNEPIRHQGIFNGVLTGQCTEVVSDDDSDKCNLGTIWINRITDKEELADVVKYSTLFLLCGSLYSDVPTEKIREIGSKNNRIGLGLGGMHEWLMQRGLPYVVNEELHKWLSIYKIESDAAAYVGAKRLDVAIPRGKRAIAPTGTIGIIAETTTGIEPLFCKSYKRRYYKDGNWMYQYVVDGAVKRLIENGVKLEDIKDSYDITFKERVKFQADVQNYVDMAISSTCNLPQWGTMNNNVESLKKNSDILLKYAKRLRGFTCYPDACRSGQPLTRVDLQEALNEEGKVFEEKENECTNGVCGV